MKRPYIISRANLKVNPLEPGLVGGWDMKQQIAGTVFDKSGNGYDGTLVGNPRQGSCLLGDYLEFDGVGGVIEIVQDFDLTTDLGCEFWFRTTDKTTLSILVASSTIALNRWSIAINSGEVVFGYYDGVAQLKGSAIDENQWYHVFAGLKSGSAFMHVNASEAPTTATVNSTSATVKTTVAARTDLNAAYFSPSDILMVNFIDVSSLTTTQIASFAAQQYALGKTALFQTLPVNNTGTVTSGNIGDSPFVANSGGFAVVDDAEVGKAIECITAGTFHVPTSLFQQSPTEAAVGGICFDFYRPAADGVSVWVISDMPTHGSEDGYLMTASSGGIIQLRVRNGGATGATLMASPASYAGDSWEHVEFKIFSGGIFHMYVNGILMPVASGTNPATDNTYNESKYIIFSLAAGCKISLEPIIKRLLP